VPPLRARREDILLLAQRFGERMARDLGREYFAGFSPAAERQLLDYGWPGNVRELRNVVERAVYRLDSARQTVERVTLDPFESPFRIAVPAAADLPAGQGAAPSVPIADAASAAVSANAARERWLFPLDHKQQMAEYELALLRAALEKAQHRQKRAAELLQLNYHQFRSLLRKYGLIEQLRGET
jgi:psp operon transcriptional activator